MSGAKKRSVATPKALTELLSSRLHTLAGLSAASTSLQVERKYGLTLLEWRSLGMLGGFAPLSLKELARRAALDKSYASRTVAGLIERGLIVSEKNDADARGVMLSLTKEGQALYKKVFSDAVARNERLMSPLTAEQRTQLMELLATLTISARRVLDHERRAAAGEDVDDDVPATTEGASVAKSSGDGHAIDLSEVRYLVSRLNELVGGA